MTLCTEKFETLGWLTRPLPLAQPKQKHWLTRPGPLTQGLRRFGNLDLTVLRETIDQPLADEKVALEIADKAPVWIREVSISINGVPCVVARSLTDLVSSRGRWRGIRQLGTRPLADLLYDEPSVLRSPFQYTRLGSGIGSRMGSPHGLQQALRVSQALGLTPAFLHTLFARRSLFVRHGKKLLVSECFLPAFWQLILQKTTP